MADLVGRDLVNKVNGDITDLFGQAQNGANALTARLANELSVAAQTAVLLAGSELDKKVRDMTQTGALLMANLNQLDQTANSIRNDAYRLKDGFVLDIRSMTQGVPGIGDRFYIQRMEGILQVKKENFYRLAVYGVNLGPDSEKHQSTLSLSINSKCDGPTYKPLANVAIDQTEANLATLQIPPEDLKDFFSPNAIVFVCASLEVNLRHKELIGRKVEHFQVPFRFSLYPVTAGVIDVSSKVSTFDWIATNITDSITLRTDDLDGKGIYNYYNLQLKTAGTGNFPPRAGDRKYDGTSIKFECVSGFDQSCNFIDVMSIGLEDQDRTVSAYFRTNSKPTIRKLSANIWVYAEKSVEDKPVAKGIPLEYGKNVLITVPLESQDFQVLRISGKTTNNEDIDVVYPSSSSVLQLVSTAPSRTIVYFVKRPDGVD